MIKLTLTDKPAELTEELEAELIAEFKANGTDVWNKTFIRKAVKDMSFSKCVYSEVRLDEESKYMEIDHFFCKDKYPDKVVEWGNLLASLKKCNVTKGSLDVDVEPIVNPFEIHPREHLYMKAFRYYPRNNSEIGKRTIIQTAINDRQHFAMKRAKVGLEVMDKLEDLEEEMNDIQSNAATTKNKITRFCNKIKRLFAQGNRKQEYAALVSTVILSEDETPKLIDFLKTRNLWDEELEELITELNFCQLLK